MQCDTHSGDGERHAKVFAPLKSEAPRRGSDQGHAVTAAHGGPVVRDLCVWGMKHFQTSSNLKPVIQEGKKRKDYFLISQAEVKSYGYIYSCIW